MRLIKYLIFFITFYSCGNGEGISFLDLKEQANRFYEQGDYEQAFKAYDRLLKNNQALPEYFYRRGRCLMVMLDLENARKDFLKAIDMNYRRADAYFNIAVTYTYIDNNLVDQYLEKCLKEDPMYEEAETLSITVDSIKRSVGL